MACLVMGLAPTTVRGAGFWNLERGAASYARAGANVADPGDPTALYLNPASLAGLRGLSLVLDANMIFDQRRFVRSPDDVDADGDTTEYEEVANTWRPTPSPSGFVAYNLGAVGLEELTLGAGVWGPAPTHRDWSPEGPQRYSEVRAHNLQIHYALGAAWSFPWLKLRVGATAMLIDQIVRTGIALSVLPEIYGEDPGADALVDVDAKDGKIFGGILGVSAQPLPWLVLAAVYQPPYQVAASGDAKVAFGEKLSGVATVTGDRVGIRLDMPPVARAAARVVDPNGAWDGELAVVWEGWSRNTGVRFQPRDITVSAFSTDYELTDVVLRYDWRDTYSVRLGGSLDVLQGRVRLRAGTYYERGAVDPKYLSPSAFDLDKVGVTTGGRVMLAYGLWADVALGWGHFLSRSVDGTNVRIVNALETDPAQRSLWPIANGDYANDQLFVMAALGWQLPP